MPLCDSRQAGALTFNQNFERIKRFRNQIGNLNERWNNRLSLKGRSLAEAYVNGYCGIVLYCDGLVGSAGESSDPVWACSVVAEQVSSGGISGPIYIDASNVGNGDGRDQEVVFVVVVEVIEPPKRFVKSILRPYLVEKRLLSTRDGALYQVQDRGGFEIFPFGMNGEMFLRAGFNSPANSGCDVIERGSEVVNCIPDHDRQNFRNWFQRLVVDINSGFLRVGKDRAFVARDDIEVAREGFGQRPQLINVAIGPFNL